MSEMSNSERAAYETRIVDLSDSCPFAGASPCTCPWHDIRGKSLAEKLKWVDALSDDRILEILAYHKLCSEGPSASLPVSA